MRLNRRKALALFGLGAAAAPAASLAAPYAGKVAFRHGVASGDPLADRVILWTRITPEDPAAQEIAYSWTLNPVDRRAGGAKSGSGVTDAGRDFTVKVDVSGLEPGRAYTYEFTVGGVTSPLGRTRTLPAGPTKDVVLAVASCALYPGGYFNAYEAIARLPRVDAVLHLGDYIYEYAPEGYGYETGKQLNRLPDPPHDCVTLADYRRRHACHRADAQLQAAHARAPWIVVWDDHETANDSYKDGAQHHDTATDGDWNVRKAAAIKAYFEWMPIREPSDHGFAINRAFHFGDVASLFMLETRLTARDKQLTYDRDLTTGPDGKPDVAAFRARLGDPGRRMMGETQEAWLAEELSASVRSGRPWQILGNEVVMARVAIPSIRKGMDEQALAKALAGLPAGAVRRIDRMESVAALGLPYGLDMWDGYPADRDRLYGMIRKAKANVVVVSGDSHAFWANELYDAPEGGNRVAVEFGATGITSPGAGDALPGVPVGEIFAKANREVVWSDQAAKGFVLLTLTKAGVTGQLMAVSTIMDRTYTTGVLKTFKATPGPEGVSGLTEA
ncbi:MAG TPA: alkaline phosphatase D family protein [Phenylobacterium sp.]|nr:alkaline phosphatase D family protein [Phenylobacterium sp.]